MEGSGERGREWRKRAKKRRREGGEKPRAIRESCELRSIRTREPIDRVRSIQDRPDRLIIFREAAEIRASPE